MADSSSSSPDRKVSFNKTAEASDGSSSPVAATAEAEGSPWDKIDSGAMIKQFVILGIVLGSRNLDLANPDNLPKLRVLFAVAMTTCMGVLHWALHKIAAKADDATRVVDAADSPAYSKAEDGTVRVLARGVLRTRAPRGLATACGRLLGCGASRRGDAWC